MSDARRSFRYPSSRWLLRQVLKALGYHANSLALMRTSPRIFREGDHDRATPFSEVDFMADALDLMTCSTLERAQKQRREGNPFEEHAADLRQAIQGWDRTVGHLNQLPEVEAGGALAALPILRMAVLRVGPVLGALHALRGVGDADKLVNPFERDAFNVTFDRFVRRLADKGTSLEEVHGKIDGLVKKATEKGLSRKTFDSWRLRAPGYPRTPGAQPRFQTARYLRVIRVVAQEVAKVEKLSNAAQFIEHACWQARWLLACNRLRAGLDEFLGVDSMGHRRVDDLVEGLGHGAGHTWEVLSSDAYVKNELAALLHSIVRGNRMPEGLAEKLGVAPEKGHAAHDLFQLLQRVGDDPEHAADLSQALHLHAVLTGGALPWLSQAVGLSHTLDMCLVQDYVGAIAEPGARLTLWHRLLALGRSPDQPESVHWRRAEMLLAITPEATRRFAVDGRVMEELERELAEAGEEGEFLVSHVDVLQRRLWQASLIGAGMPLAQVEDVAGQLQSFGEGDTFAAYGAAYSAVLSGDAGVGLEKALEALTAAPQDPDVVSVLASAVAAAVEKIAGEARAEPATKPTVVILVLRCLSALLTLSDRHPENLDLLRAYAHGVLTYAGVVEADEEAPEGTPERVGAELLDALADILDDLLETHPDDGMLHQAQGQALYWLGYDAEARRHAKAADRLGHPELWNAMRSAGQ